MMTSGPGRGRVSRVGGVVEGGGSGFGVIAGTRDIAGIWMIEGGLGGADDQAQHEDAEILRHCA